MNKKISSPLKVLSALTFALCVVPTFASTCDPQLLQAAQAQQQQNVQAAAKDAEAVYGGHTEQPDWLKDSDGLLTACTSNNWPSLKVSQPILQSLLSKAQEKATKAACNKARDAVSQASGKVNNVLGTIPGYSSLGSSSNLGSWGDIGELGSSALSNATNSLTNGASVPSSWSDVVNSIPGVTSGSGTTLPKSSNIPGISGTNAL